MEITPVTPTTRTRKVRAAKPAEPKSGAKSVKAATSSIKAKPKVALAKPESADKPAARNVLGKRKQPSISPQQHIAMAAYFLAEQRQFAPGFELQDWLTAERLVLAAQGQS